MKYIELSMANLYHIFYGQDVHYLQPYIDEVIRERKEKEGWEKKF